MKLKNEKLIASMKMKDVITKALTVKPMSFAELSVYLNLSKPVLTNHMTQLKKFGFVRYSEHENHIFKDKRKYYAVPNVGSYSEMIDGRRAINTQDMTKSDKVSKFASVVVTCDKYHTKGNRTKISAWHGYSSMAGL